MDAGDKDLGLFGVLGASFVNLRMASYSQDRVSEVSCVFFPSRLDSRHKC